MSETLHAEAPLANDPAARNPDGSLKTPTISSTEPAKTEPKVEPKVFKVEPKVEKVEKKEVKEEPKTKFFGKGKYFK